MADAGAYGGSRQELPQPRRRRGSSSLVRAAPAASSVACLLTALLLVERRMALERERGNGHSCACTHAQEALDRSSL